LNGGVFTGDWIEHPSVSRHTRRCPADGDVFVVDALMDDLLRPRMLEEHVLRQVVSIPQQVGYSPKVELSGSRRRMVRKTVQECGERIGYRDQETADVHLVGRAVDLRFQCGRRDFVGIVFSRSAHKYVLSDYQPKKV
jgi:hypothetical protein